MRSAITREDYLLSSLISLKPTGPTGFEGLIRELLESWTGHAFRLARAGSQSGKDVTSDSPSGIFIAAEMKRYDQESSLRLRDLLGGFSEAIQSLPNLDLWVLATTTEIGDKETEGIKKQSEQSGIESLLLDSRADGSGYLEAFCAKYPDVINDFCRKNIPDIKIEALNSRIHSIQNHANYEKSVKQLSEILDAAVFGFNGARYRASRWLSSHIDSRIESMAAFLQDIGLHDKNRRSPIIRNSLNGRLNSWWKNRNVESAHAVLLGEEGTGKTWAAMAWLASRFGGEAGPILIPVTSIQLSGTTDLCELIVEILIKRCGKTEKFWKKRLKGWLSRPEADGPLFLLYLDGLNEKPNVPWRNLIVQANSRDWCGRVAIYMTSRKEFYQKKVAFGASGIKEIETTGYDDTELHQELDRAGISKSVIIPEELRFLIRKPRYCDLALQYFAQLLASGDLTVERLLYQDYKEREAKKLGQPVTEEDFNQILCELARKYINGVRSFGKADLVTILPAVDESGAVLQEIIDGGLLEKSNQLSAPYRVETLRLVYGLGMVLADHISNEPRLSIDEYTDAAETWLEPQPDMELKVSIVGTAAFMSIMNNNYPINARRALLRLWIGSRNMTDSQERAVSAHLPYCVHDIVEIADTFWSTHQDNGVAQGRLATAFLKLRDDSKVKPILIEACKRWMSYVNINGHPLDRHLKNANIDELKRDLFKRLGKNVAIGNKVCFYDRTFFIIEDDNLLRMARFAMFLISAGDRLPFIEAFFQWAISRRLMGRHSEFDEAAWVLRLADEDLWPAFAPNLTQMAMSDDETLKKAAHLLLDCISSRAANELLEEHLYNLYPATMLQLEYGKDPYASIFALSSRDDYEPCMARDDLQLWHIASKINKYLADPDITAPDRFILRLCEAAQSLPASGYHASFSHTIEDHQIETFLPILARFTFQNLAELLRRAVQTIDQRNDEGIRQLLIHLPELGIVLHAPELGILDKILAIYHRKACIWPRHGDCGPLDREIFAEARGALVRIMHLTADETVAFILNRPDKALDLESLEQWFQPLPEKTVGDYLLRLLTESSPVSQYRIMWLLYNSKPVLSDAHRRMLIAWTESSDNALKYCALQFAWLAGDQGLIDHILHKDGSLHPETSRIDSWIANIYWKYGRDLPLHILIHRLPLEWVGDIICENSCRSDDVQQFANLLNSVWQIVVQHKEIDDIVFLSPQVEKYQKAGANFIHYEEPSSDRSIRFISSYMSWHSGRHEEETGNPNFSLQESPEDFAARQRMFHEQIKVLLHEERTRWRYCQLNTEVLTYVCRDNPEMVEKWIDAVFENNSGNDPLFSYNGFYQSLCSALVKIGHPRGFMLWRKIREHPHRVNFNDGRAGCDWMTCLSFSAMPSADAGNAAVELLENCQSDIGLLELANTACAYRQQTWILERTQDLIGRPQLWLRAKGLMFISLADMEQEIDSLIQSSDFNGTWVEKLLPQMKYLHDRNQWARHWYNRFLTVSDNDEAFACFQLVLKSIDRRCRLWMDELDEGARMTGDVGKRRRNFRLINNDQIKRAIKENEKELDDHFLTLKFEKGQILPFI